MTPAKIQFVFGKIRTLYVVANFYTVPFPDSEVTAAHKAPSDFPGGKAGQILTVEFTVFGIPCLGFNGGEVK